MSDEHVNVDPKLRILLEVVRSSVEEKVDEVEKAVLAGNTRFDDLLPEILGLHSAAMVGLSEVLAGILDALEEQS